MRAPREGTIRAGAGRDGTLFEGRLRYVDAAGVARRRSVYGKSAGEAADKLRQLRAELDAGVLPSRGRGGHTVASWAAEWSSTVLPLMGRAPNSVDAYRNALSTHVVPELGHVKLTALTAADVRRLLVTLDAKTGQHGRPLSASSRRLALQTLRLMLTAAVADQLISRDPTIGVPWPAKARQRPEPVPLDADQLGRFLAGLTGPDRALVLTYAGTGARRHELAELLWDNVDLDAGQLRVVKGKTGNAARTIALPPVVVAALRAHRRDQLTARMAAGVWDDTGHVFTDRHGAPRKLAWITRRVGSLLRAAGHDGATHLLRHTVATLALAQGADVGSVASQLGQAPATLLSTYVHATSTGQRHAAGLLDAVIGGTS